MTFEAFINTYLGKFVEWDNNSAKNQCVDFVKAYIELCHGIPTRGSKACWGNAKDYWYSTSSPLLQKFTKIKNTPSFVPKQGDICIWTNGKWGHIAVASGEGNTSTFYSYDQNYPTGSSVKRVRHNYSGFAGVLRPKATIYDKPTASTKTATVMTALNVRSAPNTSGKILRVLDKGAIVKVLSISNGWANIAEGQFVSAKYIK